MRFLVLAFSAPTFYWNQDNCVRRDYIYIYIYSSATTTRSLEKAIISLRPIALQLTSGHTSSPELLKQILVHPENGSWSIRGLWLGVLGLLRKWSLGPSQVCVIHNLRQILRSYFLSKDSFRSNLTDSDSRCHFQNPQTCFKQFQLGVLKSSVHSPIREISTLEPAGEASWILLPAPQCLRRQWRHLQPWQPGLDMAPTSGLLPEGMREAWSQKTSQWKGTSAMRSFWTWPPGFAENATGFNKSWREHSTKCSDRFTCSVSCSAKTCRIQEIWMRYSHSSRLKHVETSH